MPSRVALVSRVDNCVVMPRRAFPETAAAAAAEIIEQAHETLECVVSQNEAYQLWRITVGLSK